MKHQIVVDLGYGDSGKGITVARLCEEVPSTAVVRFSGGAQAAHNVITDDGRHHTFAQFGSGTFTPRVRTHLSQYFLLELDSLLRENDHLKALGVPDALERLTIDPRVQVITPYMVEFNRQTEIARGDSPHGSCARGIGATVEYELRNPGMGIMVRDLFGPSETLMWKLECQQNWLGNHFPGSQKFSLKIMMRYLLRDAQELMQRQCVKYDYFALPELAALTDRLIFEGSQGVLLDQHAGFHPHTTWSTTTPHNAKQLIHSHNLGEYEVLGVVRTYMTRHGHGPFVTEDPALNVIPELHNEDGRWMGAFRRGHFDVPAVRYAIQACAGIDGLVVTHADHSLAARISLRNTEPYRAQYLKRDDLELRTRLTGALFDAAPKEYAQGFGPHDIAMYLDQPLVMIGHGPKIGDYHRVGAFQTA